MLFLKILSVYMSCVFGYTDILSCVLKEAIMSKKKLLDLVREQIRNRHYSMQTEKSYVGWIKRYIFFHQKKHPIDMGKAEIEAFLTHLAVDRKVTATTSWTAKA